MQGFLEVTMTLLVLMEEWRGYDNVVDYTSTSSIEKEDATVPTFCLINGLDMRVMVSEFDSVHAIKMHNIVQKRFS